MYFFLNFFFLRTGFLLFNDAAAHRRHNEVLKNTDARNTFEWEINLNGRKTRIPTSYIYNVITTRNNIIPTVLVRWS